MTSFSALARLCARLPYPAARFLVRGVLVKGLLMGWPPARRTALANLRRILGRAGRDPAEAPGLLGESLELYARFLLCMMALPEEERFAAERVALECLPLVRELAAEGKGLILATPNFGFAGHGAWALLKAGVEWKMPILDREFLAHFPPDVARRFLTVGRAGREILAELKAGGTMFMIVDINYLPRRRTTPFFGAPAPLGYAASRLAQASGAPILPVYAVAEGTGCRLQADEPVRAEGRPIEDVQADVARSMERFIARHPEQWLVYEDFWDVAGMDRKYRLARRLAG